jgi:hypothetical protein
VEFLLEGYLNCCQISVTAVSLYLSRTLPRLFLACISFLGGEREMKKKIMNGDWGLTLEGLGRRIFLGDLSAFIFRD